MRFAFDIDIIAIEEKVLISRERELVLHIIPVQNIECKLYPGARHELLVETNKQEVFADIADWLDKQLQH